MTLYHVTTPKKARLYRQSGKINAPVRGFDTPQAAMFWAMKTGRQVIYKMEVEALMLPDHHNAFGKAYWTPDSVSMDAVSCYCSAGEAFSEPPMDLVPA